VTTIAALATAAETTDIDGKSNFLTSDKFERWEPVRKLPLSWEPKEEVVMACQTADFSWLKAAHMP
jgi:hypothetical protein